MDVPNVVQYLNFFETDKYIVIQMEHLKGMQMKRDLNQRLESATSNIVKTENDHSRCSSYQQEID